MKKAVLFVVILLITLVIGWADPVPSSVRTELGPDGVMESIVTISIGGTVNWSKFSFQGIAQPQGNSNKVELIHNTEGSIFGLNLRQASKSNTAVLLCIDRNANIRIISDFNRRIKNLYPNDAAVNDYDLRITSIDGDICHLDAVTYGKAGVSSRPLSVRIGTPLETPITLVAQGADRGRGR